MHGRAKLKQGPEAASENPTYDISLETLLALGAAYVILNTPSSENSECCKNNFENVFCIWENMLKNIIAQPFWAQINLKIFHVKRKACASADCLHK